MKRWFIYRHGWFSCIDPRHWGHSEKSAVILSSTRRRRPWVLACTRPKTCNQHGLSDENGSDRDALEGGRELGGFSKRQAVIADMAKWGSGEASGSRSNLVRVGIIGMAGVRTIKGDGLVRSRTRTNPCPAMLPARRRR